MNIPNKYIKNVLPVLLIVIAIATFYGLSKYNAAKQKQSIDYSLSEINQMSEENRIKALEDQVKAFQNETASLKEDVSSSVKYAAYIKLAEAQMELGKNQEALDSLNRIPEDKKNNSRVASAYIRAHKGVGDLTKTKELSAEAIKLYDEDPIIWIAYLELITDMPNDQLNNLYREAVVKTQSNVQVMISYAKFAEKAGDKATAIAAWETAINGDQANEAKYREEIARLR